MPGRMGGKQRTVKNVWVYKIDPARNLMWVKGQVVIFLRTLLLLTIIYETGAIRQELAYCYSLTDQNIWDLRFIAEHLFLFI